jgi:hypothetical protein
MRDSHARKSLRDITTHSAVVPFTLRLPLARFKRTLAAMPAELHGANLREAFRHL